MSEVLRLAELARAPLEGLLTRWGLELAPVGPGDPIPGSYWGEPEAGLVRARLHARPDTPVHSILHEAGHFVCMDAPRRAVLERDAGGEEAEECAVCLLQLIAAESLPGVGRERVMADMDAWGYSFRLGSTGAWYAQESAPARAWLEAHGILSPGGTLTGRIRA